MTSLKTTIIRGGLETLYFSGANMLMRPFVDGVGVILTLHHVRPPRLDAFQPNRLLEITPKFLERVVRYLRRRGLDVDSLDEVYRRLVERDFARRFVAITIDDGYRDTLQWAYPVLKRYETPFAVYIPTSFPDRLGELWWLALEAVVARNNRVGLLLDGARAGLRLRDRDRETRPVRSALSAMSGASRPRKSCASCARPQCALSGRHRRVLRRSLHELGRARRRSPGSAGHDRRAHRQPRDAREGAGAHGAVGNGR